MKKKKTKIKTRKSVVKRFKITKNGKVLFRGSHVQHLRRKKTKAQLRRQKVPQRIHGALARKIKKVIGSKK
ncbi:MAG: bL35 family ribosomal protein [Candidatus Shapirobacteria bacterium]